MIWERVSQTAKNKANTIPGKEIHCDADALTPVQMAEELSRLTGKKIKTGGLTRDTFYSDEYKKAMPLELWINYKAILDG